MYKFENGTEGKESRYIEAILQQLSVKCRHLDTARSGLTKACTGAAGGSIISFASVVLGGPVMPDVRQLNASSII